MVPCLGNSHSLTEETKTMTNAIKSRRYYMTKPGPGVAPERVRVTGWADVQVGTGSAAYPRRTERYCRVRFDGDRASSLLMHPSSLDAAAEVTR
jgi:hypothetical protein